MDSGPERRLAAILFTDIVGYTALMAESERKALQVRARHRELVRPLVEKYNGEWIEEIGDESLSRFPSAVDAVNCALAVQAELDGDPELQLRIGIHLGETLSEGSRIYGEGVNVASRIRPLAEPGGICVSGEVYRSVRNQPGIEATARGEQELKNVPERVAVWAIAGTAGPPSAAQRRGASPGAAPSVRSIAVLPLESLGSPDHAYVADGVTDALIESLAKVGPELLVISRTSVKQYKGTTKTAREIADELGVEFLIEGTAQRQDDRVLIRVQLIEAREDAHVWAESYERDVRDFFSVQREIARTISGEVHVALRPEPPVAAPHQTDPEALDLYLRAISLRGGLTDTLVTSWGPPTIELLERSVALDPEFAEAWVALSEAHNTLGIVGIGVGSSDNFVRAREAAVRALDLDERLGAAHAALGQVRLCHDWDFAGARRAFERAVELAPSDPHALNGLGQYLLFVGQGESPEVERLFERILQVAPLDLYFRKSRIVHLLFTREYERALAEVGRIRELDPEFVDANVAFLYSLLGRDDEAVDEYRAFFSRGDLEVPREAFERGSVEGGWHGGLRALADLVLGGATEDVFGVLYLTALNLALIGETDDAMTWLERAYEAREPLLTNAKTDPRLDSLRPDPRFDDLLQRIGFPTE